jgi:alanine racemase
MLNLHRYRNSYAEINLGHLKHNIGVLKANSTQSGFFCPMVKANAYGHGDIEVARLCEEQNASHLGVALIEEGIRLRGNNLRSPVLIYGFFDSEGAEALVKYSLTPVLSSWEQLEKLARVTTSEDRFAVHLKFNTGMSRLGFEVEEAVQLKQYFQKQSHLNVEGVCTHFLNSEDFGDPEGHTNRQLKSFAEVQSLFADQRIHFHLHSTHSFLKDPQTFLGSRPGLSLYGVTSFADPGLIFDLKPVMTLKSHVAMIRKVKEGETVSYGARWKASRDSVIAVVPLGYADGYPRLLSNSASMLIRNMRAPVRGSVCMDYTMIDVTDVPNPTVGEVIEVFGSKVSVNELAQQSQTISYEILTGISSRVPRVYVH